MDATGGRLAAAAGVLVAAVAAGGCDRPPTTASEFNNSGSTVSGQPAPNTQRALRDESNPAPPRIEAREIPPTNTDPPQAPSPAQAGAR